MACGATLKRHHEFDPLCSPAHSPKRLCMSGDLMSPLSHRRLLTSGGRQTPARVPFNADQSSQFDHNSSELNPQLFNLSKFSPPHVLPFATEASHHAVPSLHHLGGSAESDHRSSAAGASCAASSTAGKDVPALTLSQVSLVCKRVVREHERRCRERLDEALNAKLTEQYESFLCFNHDQLKRRFANSETSYVS